MLDVKKWALEISELYESFVMVMEESISYHITIDR